MSDVKRYKVSNGPLMVRGAEAGNSFNPQDVDVILASDYDALAAELAEVEKRLDGWYTMEARIHTVLRQRFGDEAVIDAVDALMGKDHNPHLDRIRELESALRTANADHIAIAIGSESLANKNDLLSKGMADYLKLINEQTRRALAAEARVLALMAALRYWLPDLNEIDVAAEEYERWELARELIGTAAVK